MPKKILSPPQPESRAPRNCNAILVSNGKKIFSWVASQAQNSNRAIQQTLLQFAQKIDQFGATYIESKENAIYSVSASMGKARRTIGQCGGTLASIAGTGAQLVVTAGAIAALRNVPLFDTAAYLLPCAVITWRKLPPTGPLSKESALALYQRMPRIPKIALQSWAAASTTHFLYQHATELILYPPLFSAIAFFNLSSNERAKLVSQIKDLNLTQIIKKHFDEALLHIAPQLPNAARELVTHCYTQNGKVVLLGENISSNADSNQLTELTNENHRNGILFQASQPPNVLPRKPKARKTKNSQPPSPIPKSSVSQPTPIKESDRSPNRGQNISPLADSKEIKSPLLPDVAHFDTQTDEASISPRSNVSVSTIISNQQLLLQSSPLDSAAETNQRKLQIQKEKTEKELHQLIQNLSSFVHLKQMFATAKIACDPAEFNRIFSQAKNPDISSLKQFFFSEYKGKLNWVKRLKIHLWSWLFSSRLFTKTLDTYFTQILEIVRKKSSDNQLIENGEAISGLVDKFKDYLDRFLGKILNYLDNQHPTAKEFNTFLDKINKDVTEEIFGISMRDTCGIFSEVLVDHLSPNVEYFRPFKRPVWFISRFIAFANRQMNWVVRQFLRRSILPNSLYSVIEKTDESTSPENLAFTTAWTKVINEQLQKLITQIEGRQAAPSQNTVLPGTENLKELVSLLFQNLQFQDLNDPGAIKRKQAEILELSKRQDFSEKVQAGIQESIVKAVKMMGSILTPQTFEEINENFLRVANTTFETAPNVTKEDAENAEKDLDKTIRTLGSKLSSKAVNDQLNPNRPEDALKLTKERFEAERQRILHAVDNIKECIDQMPIPTGASWKKETDILSDLGAIQKILKEFDENNLNKAVVDLSQPDQNAIRQPLIPIYMKIVDLGKAIKELQTEQLEQQANFENASHYTKINNEIVQIGNKTPLTQVQKHLSHIETEILSAEEARECRRLLPPTRALAEITKRCISKEAELNHLAQLHEQLTALQKAISNNSGEQKSNCIKQIHSTLTQLPEIAQQLNVSIKNCSSQKTENSSLWNKLFSEIQQIKESCTARKKESKTLLLTAASKMKVFCETRERFFGTAQDRNHQNLINQKKSFIQLVESLKNLTEEMQLSQLLHLNAEHLSLLGGAGLAALTLFSPPLGLAAAGAAYAGVHQMPEIIRAQNADTTLNRTAAGIGAAVGMGLLSIPGIGAPAAIALSALTGARAGSQLIDRTIEAGEKGVSENIEKFFSQTYSFLKSRIYVGLIKIAMWQIIESYRLELKKKK